MDKNLSVREIVNYGIDSLDNDLKVKIDLKDLIFIYKTIEELRRFFHNRNHYKNIETVHEYFSGDKGGMYSVLNEVYTKRLDKYLTHEIEEIIESEQLDPLQKPFYYNL